MAVPSCDVKGSTVVVLYPVALPLTVDIRASPEGLAHDVYLAVLRRLPKQPISVGPGLLLNIRQQPVALLARLAHGGRVDSQCLRREYQRLPRRLCTHSAGRAAAATTTRTACVESAHRAVCVCVCGWVGGRGVGVVGYSPRAQWRRSGSARVKMSRCRTAYGKPQPYQIACIRCWLETIKAQQLLLRVRLQCKKTQQLKLRQARARCMK